MNLDARWCDLSVRDYLVLERAWGWATGLLQLGVVAGGAFVGRAIWRRWRSRRARAAPPALCGHCGAPTSQELARMSDLDRALASWASEAFKCLEIATDVEPDGSARPYAEGEEARINAALDWWESWKNGETGHSSPHAGSANPAWLAAGKPPD